MPIQQVDVNKRVLDAISTAPQAIWLLVIDAKPSVGQCLASLHLIFGALPVKLDQELANVRLQNSLRFWIRKERKLRAFNVHLQDVYRLVGQLCFPQQRA